MTLQPDKEILDARMVTERLQALGKRIDYLFQMTGETGMEEVLEDINAAIEMFLEMDKDLSRCRRKHGSNIDELTRKADVAKKLANAVFNVRTKCSVCNGPCNHFDLNSIAIRQLDSAMQDARSANVFEVQKAVE